MIYTYIEVFSIIPKTNKKIIPNVPLLQKFLFPCSPKIKTFVPCSPLINDCSPKLVKILNASPLRVRVLPYLIWAMSWENLFMPYANNEGADQPAHLRNLISAFVVHCLDSKINLVSRFKISSLYLSSVDAQASLCVLVTLVANPKDRFSRDVAHIFLTVLCISEKGVDLLQKLYRRPNS